MPKFTGTVKSNASREASVIQTTAERPMQKSFNQELFYLIIVCQAKIDSHKGSKKKQKNHIYYIYKTISSHNNIEIEMPKTSSWYRYYLSV